jgi:hypothetical protein
MSKLANKMNVIAGNPVKVLATENLTPKQHMKHLNGAKKHLSTLIKHHRSNWIKFSGEAFKHPEYTVKHKDNIAMALRHKALLHKYYTMHKELD